MAAFFLVASLAAIFHGARVVSLDLEFDRLGAEIGKWGRDGYTPAPELVAETAAELEALLVSAADQPDYLSLYATSLAWQGYLSTEVDDRIAFANRAMEAQLAAAKRRPAHRHSWLKVVEYASRATTGAPVLAVAEQRVALLQPRGR